MGLNDDAWARLFERYDIAQRVARDGSFIISASQIKPYREPRLMTKFDHIINLPAPFQEHRLAILPISRGDYVISSFSAYQPFPPEGGPCQAVRLPAQLQSLASQFLVSEAIALNCASACGILADFLEEESPVATVSGRMGSGRFDFWIDTAAGPRPVSVNNAQIEIDAAYEGARSLSLFEAKCSLSSDFLIRQLYYPFRTWRDRVSKRVRPVFLVFSGGVFHLYEYRFENPDNYNSLALIKQRRYAIDTDITLDDIWDLLRSVRPVAEPEIPFPQADTFTRIVNLVELLAHGPMTGADITAQYLFAPRQTGYYTDAGRYLGLIRREGPRSAFIFTLSERGRRLMSLGVRERQLTLMSAILEHEVFRRVLEAFLARGRMPSKAFVVQTMRQCGLYRVQSENTYERRASTVLRWLEWILSAVRR